jgi:CBS domain-containing protein
VEEIALLAQSVPQMSSSAELRAYCDRVAASIGPLLNSGARASAAGRMVTAAYDALQARLLRDAEAELGPPPCPYAWLVLGSAGRCEQTPHTDQDNALVYADDASPIAERYFAALADRIVGQLVECGFPRCPGEIMATNPQWRRSLRVWQRYFQRWIMTPDAEALLRVSIFFDYRQIHGALDVEAALRPTVLRARDEHTFLAYLAHAAVRQPAPIGLFGRLVLDRQRAERGVLDLKLHGTALIVDLARLFALEAGSRSTNTLDRLRDAAVGGNLSRSGAEDLAAAFEQINLLRTRHQYDLIQRREPPTNDLPIGRLSLHERRALRDALRVVARIQRSVVFSFQTAWFG